MCDACVIESVKTGMMSRRHLFAGAAATGMAAAAMGLTSARPALARAGGRAVDLTHTYDGSFPTFDGQPGIIYDRDKEIARDGYQLYRLTIFEHTGTHIDAPLHFSADGASVDELPVEGLVCPICVIDLTAKAREDANAMVEVEDIEAWVSAHGAIPAGALVAMNSGWAARVGQPDYRTDAGGAFAFPGFSRAATDMLAGMDVAGIGVDTLSLDPGNSADFAVHNTWLPGGRYGIENLANLDRLPATGATVFVGAPKHKGGTGGPARVVAVL